MMFWVSLGLAVGPRLSTQASIVKLLVDVKSNAGTLPRLTPPPSGRPLNEKAWPTFPGTNPTPDSTVPWLRPTTSFAFPSPGHQLIAPEGRTLCAMAWPVRAHVSRAGRTRTRFLGIMSFHLFFKREQGLLGSRG